MWKRYLFINTHFAANCSFLQFFLKVAPSANCENLASFFNTNTFGISLGYFRWFVWKGYHIWMWVKWKFQNLLQRNQKKLRQIALAKIWAKWDSSQLQGSQTGCVCQKSALRYNPCKKSRLFCLFESDRYEALKNQTKNLIFSLILKPMKEIGQYQPTFEIQSSTNVQLYKSPIRQKI